MMKNKRYFPLRYARNEYGKAIRKAYESGKQTEKRAKMTQLEVRKDNVINTITTVQKDNLILEVQD